ncbi:MAG: DJ-1/PfpI family protein [Flavisolibacter sp.]|nr:DJ-1/PfpI family protein [Flavisolibacter sp.]
MKLAYIVFDGITWLDFIGVYDPLSRLKSLGYLPELSWQICSHTDKAMDNFGLAISPTEIRKPLDDYDAVIVPGGFGTRKLQFDIEFISWLKTAKDVQYKISVCTGSLLLGAAGFLNDKSATTNFHEYEALKPYCKKVSKQRIVDDNNVITAGAVAASLDLGLYLCEKWAGTEAAKKIAEMMNYTFMSN